MSNAAAASLRWYRDVVGTGRNSSKPPAAAMPTSNSTNWLPPLSGQPRSAACIPGDRRHARLKPEGPSCLHRAVLRPRPRGDDAHRDGGRGAGDAGHVRAVDGGRVSGSIAAHRRRGESSTLWNQIQADVYGRPVETLRVGESAVLGAAILGGVGAGVFVSLEEGVTAMVHVADRIERPQRHQRSRNSTAPMYRPTRDSVTAARSTLWPVSRLCPDSLGNVHRWEAGEVLRLAAGTLPGPGNHGVRADVLLHRPTWQHGDTCTSRGDNPTWSEQVSPTSPKGAPARTSLPSEFPLRESRCGPRARSGRPRTQAAMMLQHFWEDCQAHNQILPVDGNKVKHSNCGAGDDSAASHQGRAGIKFAPRFRTLAGFRSRISHNLASFTRVVTWRIRRWGV